MIAEFEQRLVDVLGARLPAPFTGRTALAPGAAPGADLQVLVGVLAAGSAEQDLNSRRPEIVPGSADPRRVLRLDCTVGIEIRATTAADRQQQVRGLDAVLYTVDAPDFQDGSALNDGTDRGFLIESMTAAAIDSPSGPVTSTTPRFGFNLLASGLFWPPDVDGLAGRVIGEIRLRGATLPVTLDPPTPVLLAGGPAVALSVKVRATAIRIAAPGAPVLPFGQLAMQLVSTGGRPGLGTLGGGSAGNGTVRLVPLANEAAAITYTPPAAPGTDQLVVALGDGTGGLGVEIARVILTVRSG